MVGIFNLFHIIILFVKICHKLNYKTILSCILYTRALTVINYNVIIIHRYTDTIHYSQIVKKI